MVLRGDHYHFLINMLFLLETDGVPTGSAHSKKGFIRKFLKEG
jgi:hypothetical protein